MVVFHPVSVAELGDAVPQTPWDLPLWSLKRQGHAGLGMPSPTCRLQASSRRSGCIPAEPYLPLKHPSNKGPCEPWQWRRKKPLLFSSFDRTAPSSFDRTTTGRTWRRRLACGLWQSPAAPYHGWLKCAGDVVEKMGKPARSFRTPTEHVPTYSQAPG